MKEKYGYRGLELPLLFQRLTFFAIVGVGFVALGVQVGSTLTAPALTPSFGTNVKQHTNSKGSDGSLSIVPDRCESPLRGHFDKIYEKGVWGISLGRPPISTAMQRGLQEILDKDLHQVVAVILDLPLKTL